MGEYVSGLGYTSAGLPAGGNSFAGMGEYVSGMGEYVTDYGDYY
jgi:hypothetical protein